MKIQRLVAGPLQTNTYVVFSGASRRALVIDPGYEADRLRVWARRHRMDVEAILLTHGHVDHCGAVSAFNVPIYIHQADMPMLEQVFNAEGDQESRRANGDAVRYLNDGMTFDVDGETLRVIHTPGHSPGSVCLLSGTVLFSGDTLFCRGVGRTDLPGGSCAELEHSLQERLFTLDPGVKVFPGHGPQTTIGGERGR